MSRYAQGTTVPMEKSRLEVERVLQRYNATGFGYSWERRPEKIKNRYGWAEDALRDVVLIGFKMPVAKGVERQVRLVVPMPHELELRSKARAEAATRQRWRALVLVLKAKLEAVASGISTLDAEFLANVVTGDGRTVGEVLLPRMSEAVVSGRLLPPASPEA